ncbi:MULTISPECIES: FixH family protein [Burkholderiaceae]|uniref:FixH family protein n=1 Tax=Burkholderiaceae TaxID=119060 RepID=UPI001F04A991|nr:MULTISPECIES: FixH family protein [Burkholderiaceae]
MLKLLLAAFVLSLLLCNAYGQQVPANLNLALTQQTNAGKYVIALEPPERNVRLNQIQTWSMTLRAPSGQLVQGAVIDVGGGMPQHGHGLPTQPQVVQQGDAGHYLLEGMKFSMPGWWVINLKVRSPMGTDAVTFNVVLPPSS